jgi:hypothetical protein
VFALQVRETPSKDIYEAHTGNMAGHIKDMDWTRGIMTRPRCLN